MVLGVAAHVGGFLLKTSATTEPVLLVADLLYQFGQALWTGVVVVVFVQLWPEAKRRQYQQVLDAYEAAAGPQARPEVARPRTRRARRRHDFGPRWAACARVKS